jgi:UDP-2,4-diacetamido-2,4,6-trideoxy-beta-L-altropyranose hydrolase
MAVGAGGTMAWERCCAALPALMASTADNQRRNTAALSARGAAIDLGDAGDTLGDRIVAELTSVASAPTKRLSMAKAAASLCDGRGTDRAMLSMLEAVRLPSHAHVRLTLAEAHHKDLFLEWQRAPGIRRYARSPEIPTADEHERWYAETMCNPNRILMLIQVGGTHAGMLRFDLDPTNGCIEVSILVAPDLQGRGIASAALALARKLAPGATFNAWIDPRNSASLKIFQRAGYKQVSKATFRSQP